MAMVHADPLGSDRVMAMLVAGLEREFGQGAGVALAQRFIAAEASEFTWEARLQERWLGDYCSVEAEDGALDRIAIIGRMGGTWFVAVSLVDGDGRAHGLIGRREFGDAVAARRAFAAQR